MVGFEAILAHFNSGGILGNHKRMPAKPKRGTKYPYSDQTKAAKKAKTAK